MRALRLARWQWSTSNWSRGVALSQPFSTSSVGRKEHDRSIADIVYNAADGEVLSLRGWVRSIRRQKRVAFAAIGDGSTPDPLQAVLKPEDVDG